MGNNTGIRRSTSAVLRSAAVGGAYIDSNHILFHSAQRSLHHLNRSAAAVWDSIDGDRSASEIIDAVAAAYDVGRDAIAGDVTAALDELVRIGAASFVDSGEGAPGPGLSSDAVALRDNGAAEAFGSARESCEPSLSESLAVGGVALQARAVQFDFEVWVDDLAMARQVRRLLSPLVVPDIGPRPAVFVVSEGPDGWMVLRDGLVVAGPVAAEAALVSLCWQVNNNAVSGSPDYVCLHAGAVECPTGGVVLMPAVADSGKSTLTLGLVRRGYGYLSDEIGAIGIDTGVVAPFPKSIALDPGSFSLFEDLSSQRMAINAGAVAQWHIDPAPRDALLEAARFER